MTTLFRLHALLALLYGLGLLLAPRMTIDLFSATPLTPQGALITRLFGAALLLIAQLAWEASRREESFRRPIARGLFVYVSTGFVVTLIGQMTGIWKNSGWTNVLSYLIFVIGYGWFLRKAQNSSGPRQSAF